MMPDFAIPPEPLTIRQRNGVIGVTVIVALSRLLFLARSPWDWDEMLFSLGVRQFDVALHHPHPPGFPLFIALGKLLTAAGLSTFHALQAIDVAGGILLVPAMFGLCRELRFRYSTSLSAALVLAFFPNVWFFGETALSDVPAVVLVVGACALLLRGCGSDAAYLSGAVVLAASAAFRPQNLVIGLIPALIATRFRFRARGLPIIFIAVAAGAAVIAVNYGAAILETGGWARYAEALRTHQQYITSVDSFRNPNRPPLLHLFDDFFIRPYHAPAINAVVTALAAISLILSVVRVRWSTLIVLASFGPFAVAAWMVLDHFSASRFSIGYAPMLAIMAADGAALVATVVRDARTSPRIEALIAAALVIGMTAWTIPALMLTSRRPSPPVQAMAWIRSHVAPQASVLYVQEDMRPYAEWYLPEYQPRWITDGAPVATLDSRSRWYVAEEKTPAAGALNFDWPHGRVWNVARRRYFTISIAQYAAAPRFTGQWYDEELTGRSVWRWMARRGAIALPPIAGPARLNLLLFTPLNVLHGRPVITIRFNGVVTRRFRPADALSELSLDATPHGLSTIVEIETDRVVNPRRENVGADDRDLGLRLDRLEWIALSN